MLYLVNILVVWSRFVELRNLSMCKPRAYRLVDLVSLLLAGGEAVTNISDSSSKQMGGMH